MDRVVDKLDEDIGKIRTVAVEYKNEGGREVSMLNVGRGGDADESYSFIAFCNEDSEGNFNYHGVRACINRISVGMDTYFINCKDIPSSIFNHHKMVRLTNSQKKLWEDRNKQ